MAKLVLKSGIEIEYDDFGCSKAPPLLVIMGLGAQMAAWQESLCQQLASHGLRVIRFDNRDSGLSTHLTDIPAPSMGRLLKNHFLGRRKGAAYLLKDMADDAVQLMDELGIRQAHVCGVSMGGMIAQEMALNYPDRLLSLTSMMSSTGNRRLPRPSKRIEWLIATKPKPNGKNTEKVMMHAVKTLRAIGGVNELAPDIEQIFEFVRGTSDHSKYQCSSGSRRQMLALLCSPCRVERLKTLDMPTLVIHGGADRLIHPAGGIETAQCIPGARLELIPNMGHYVPESLYAELTDMIASFALRSMNTTANLCLIEDHRENRQAGKRTQAA